LAYLFEHSSVGCQVRVPDLAVEVDDELELADRPAEVSATIAAAAACSRDNFRSSTPAFFRGLTIFAVITHSAHPAEPKSGESGQKHR
jgi:hypothetical protein